MSDEPFPPTVPVPLQTEMLYKKNPKLLNQFQYSEREGVPLLVILGEEETARGGVKIRDTHTRQEVRVLCIYVHNCMSRNKAFGLFGGRSKLFAVK